MYGVKPDMLIVYAQPSHSLIPRALPFQISMCGVVISQSSLVKMMKRHVLGCNLEDESEVITIERRQAIPDSAISNPHRSLPAGTRKAGVLEAASCEISSFLEAAR